MKNILIIVSILIIFLFGYFIGRLNPFKIKNIEKTEIIFKDNLKADDLRKMSEIYIDSANKELINYYSRYLYRHNNLLPNYYMTFNKDSIEFNKENFFYYYSMYKITDYLSTAKSCIINNLINESVKDSVIID